MQRQKILIVDDEAGMRELLADLLVDMGCDLYFAKDGLEGLEKVVEVKPDVVLLDIMMPKMDGFQVCRELRSRADISSIPVIMVTGNNTEESARRGVEVGADDVLAKPFNVSELKLRLKTILQMNRFRLMASERSQFKWVVDHSRSGFVIFDKHYQITYMNSRAKIFLGISEDDNFLGKDFLSVVKGKFECTPNDLWEKWPNVDERSFIVRPETSRAQALWLKLEVVPADVHANQRSIRLMDVTEEMMMFHNRWQFENMVSHKLRTPLNGLIGFLDALDMNRDTLGGEENVSFLEEAVNSAERLNQSIKGILEHLVSRRNRDEAVVQATSLSMVENYAHQLALTQGVHSMDISLDPPLLMRSLMLSNESVIQIFQEIFDNSVKFHPMRKPNIRVNIGACRENFVTVSIEDDGCCVNSVALERLGTPFYQDEKNFTGEIPGMGLGLSMISTMVKTIGGNLKISNRKDSVGLMIELDIPLLIE